MHWCVWNAVLLHWSFQPSAATPAASQDVHPSPRQLPPKQPPIHPQSLDRRTHYTQHTDMPHPRPQQRIYPQIVHYDERKGSVLALVSLAYRDRWIKRTLLTALSYIFKSRYSACRRCLICIIALPFDYCLNLLTGVILVRPTSTTYRTP